jgi:hypothetical protein
MARTSGLARAVFVAFGLLAVLYALPSVGYPLGPEQAASSYIAREWWQHNLIPYRDVFDPRIPGIHFVYLLAQMFFGAGPHAIRILELMVVIAAGVAAAQAAAWRRLKPLELAPILLVSAAFYYSVVDDRTSAQAEIWAGICLLAAQSSIAVDRNRRRAAIVSGLWSGCAVILLPQTLLFCPLLFTQALVGGIADRPEPEKLPSVAETTAAYCVGLVQPPGFFAAYFATRGAFGAFYRTFVDATCHAGPWPGGFTDWLSHTRVPLMAAGALWALALVLRLKRDGTKKLWVSALAPAFFALGLLAIWAQGSAHPSRWVLLIPTLTWCAADGLIAIARFGKALSIAAALAVVALLTLASDHPSRTARFWQAGAIAPADPGGPRGAR